MSAVAPPSVPASSGPGEAERDRDELIGRIHDTPTLAVLAVTGGAACALSDLLNVPGASRTVLELRVPYAPAALRDLLGAEPARAASAATAAAMAGACRRRALHLVAPDAGDGDAGALVGGGPAVGDPPAGDPPLVGVACTAALASDRPKRGEHRAHVALCDGERTRVWTLVLDKGARTRPEEDRLAGDVVLGALAEGCGLPGRWPTLGPGDDLREEPAPPI